MKKQTTIFMLALLLVSLVPISFAQGNVESSKPGTFTIKQSEVTPNGLIMKTPKLVVQNTTQWRVKTAERIISKIESAEQFIERLSENQTNIFLHLSRAQQKGILVMENESALQAMEKFSLKLVNKSLMFKKRLIAQEKLKIAENNYVKAKQNYLMAMNSYKEAKGLFIQEKEMLKQCIDSETEQCIQFRERAENHSREMIINSANMIIEHLNKIKEKVNSSEEMDDERAEEIISEINGYISELEDAIAQAEAAETKAEIKEAAKTVSKLWIRIRNRERLHAASVVKARIWGIIKRSEHLEQRLDSTLAKMEEQGINVTEIDLKVDEFSEKIEQAKSKYEQAQDLIDGVYFEEDKEKLKEIVDQAKQLIDEAHELLKEAHTLLVEIVRDIKAAGGEITPETEDDEDDYEVVEEEKEENITLSSSVKGCAETKEGTTAKSIGKETEKEPTIKVNGNNVVYSRALNHLCCRKAEIEKEIDDFTINIYEIWTGIGCKCICFSEIEAKLKNIPSGTYKVNVYEKGTQPGTDEPMEQTLIISEEITVQ